MKRFLIGTLFLAVLLAGCNGVYLSAEYSSLLDRTTAYSQGIAAKASAGDLDSPQMVKALNQQADLWQKFKDARDGRNSEGVK